MIQPYYNNDLLLRKIVRGDKMGGGGEMSGGTYVVNGRYGDFPVRNAKPNSRYDLYVNGVLVQSRFFDYEGKATYNKDYHHQDSHSNHEFPHTHSWTWKNGIPYQN